MSIKVRDPILPPEKGPMPLASIASSEHRMSNDGPASGCFISLGKRGDE